MKFWILSPLGRFIFTSFDFFFLNSGQRIVLLIRKPLLPQKILKRDASVCCHCLGFRSLKMSERLSAHVSHLLPRNRFLMHLASNCSFWVSFFAHSSQVSEPSQLRFLDTWILGAQISNCYWWWCFSLLILPYVRLRFLISEAWMRLKLFLVRDQDLVLYIKTWVYILFGKPRHLDVLANSITLYNITFASSPI